MRSTMAQLPVTADAMGACKVSCLLRAAVFLMLLLHVFGSNSNRRFALWVVLDVPNEPPARLYGL